MGDSSNTGSSSAGGITGFGILTAIYAFATTPEMTGLRGAFAAAMTGMGTSLEATLYGVAGAVIGAVGGGLIGSLVGKGKEFAAGLGLLGFLGVGLYGVPTAYHDAKDIVINGLKRPAITQNFNSSANTPMNCSIAPLTSNSTIAANPASASLPALR